MALSACSMEQQQQEHTAHLALGSTLRTGRMDPKTEETDSQASGRTGPDHLTNWELNQKRQLSVSVSATIIFKY